MPPREFHDFLDDIIRAATDIAAHIDGYDFHTFAGDRKTFQAVLLNLEIIGEAASRIPDDIRALAPDVEWRRIKDFRNVIAHNYFAIDLPTIWETATSRVPDLRQSILDLKAKLPPV